MPRKIHDHGSFKTISSNHNCVQTYGRSQTIKLSGAIHFAHSGFTNLIHTMPFTDRNHDVCASKDEDARNIVLDGGPDHLRREEENSMRLSPDYSGNLQFNLQQLNSLESLPDIHAAG